MWDEDWRVIDFAAVLLGGHADTWGHGGTDGNALEIVAFHAARFQVHDVLNEGIDVVDQLGGIEAELAHGGMDVSAGVIAELDLARLVLTDRLGHFGSY